MANQIQICNLALAHLGASSISSITEASREAQVCKLHYDLARDSVLREHPWNFATKRLALALLAVTPVGFDYAYAYPTDCLFAREIWRSVSTDPLIVFEVQAKAGGGRQIVTDAVGAVLEYTAQITDEAQFDASFVDAFSWRLAADIAVPLTKSLPISQAMLTVYANRLNSAAVRDGQEGRTDPEFVNSWIQVRL